MLSPNFDTFLRLSPSPRSMRKRNSCHSRRPGSLGVRMPAHVAQAGQTAQEADIAGATPNKRLFDVRFDSTPCSSRQQAEAHTKRCAATAQGTDACVRCRYPQRGHTWQKGPTPYRSVPERTITSTHCPMVVSRIAVPGSRLLAPACFRRMDSHSMSSPPPPESIC